jgi:uncharacterized protein DUF2752
MQLIWVRPSKRTIDYELVFLVATVGGAAGAASWLWLGLPWPHCAFLALTGRPCVTCGATRAALQLAHGHLAAALRFNPLVTLGYLAIALFDLYALAVLVARAPRLRAECFSNGEKIAIRIGVIALLALNWSYLLFLA